MQNYLQTDISLKNYVWRKIEPVFVTIPVNCKNGDHLLAVGDVRLWGMGAEQVAAILRQAGQDAIRLVIARPVDPSSPPYAVSCLKSPSNNLKAFFEAEKTSSALFLLGVHGRG